VLHEVAQSSAAFKSLHDHWADTTTPHGRLMLTILGGLAEFERSLIKARTVPSTSDHRSTASASSSEPPACAALSSARSACAFAAFSRSGATPSQRCLKDAFTFKPQALLATVHVIAGPAAKQRAVRLGLSFAGSPRRLWRILFFSLGPIAVILKSLQIRLQRPERQFGKGCINARRSQSRDAALLFGDHSSRFFDMARYSAAKIIVRYHISEPNEVTSDLAPLPTPWAGGILAHGASEDFDGCLISF
jgi:hypothetical protein